MAMAFRVRRLKEAYRLLPLLSAGINTRCRYRCHQDHRYPFLQIIGFQDLKIPLCSSNICTHLLGRTSKEYIAFPILLANKDVPEIACEACYVLFNGSKSSSIYYGKEANIMILDKGGISVDESGNRLFLSDSNHHRVIVLDGNGMILDSIGSSPGHEDGEFESAKLRCPAASFYHAAEDCLYLVDSENHAIRRADMGKRIVETLYPRSETNKNSSIWSWILGKLRPTNDLDAESEKLNLDVSVFPWHILKSPNGDLLIFNRSCETLWIMDFASGLIREVVKGFSNILEICEPLILEKLTLLNQIPNDWLQQQVDAHFSSKRIPYVELISSVGTFQYQILLCDTVGQTVSKLDRNLGSISGFQFSNLGILGFPYWSLSPLERLCAADAALAGNSIDHIESFKLLPENLMDIIIITRFHHGGKFVQGGRVVTPGVFKCATSANINIGYKPRGLQWKGRDAISTSQLQRMKQSKRDHFASSMQQMQQTFECS